MIRTLISDLGKVILWFDNRIFFKKMTPYCRLPIDKIREYTHADLELIEAFDSGRISPDGFYEEVTARLDAKIGYEEFYAAYCDVFSPNPPVIEILKKLKGTYRLILLSNTDVKRYAFIRRTFPEIQFFDGYVLSYEAGMLKPDPRIYKAAMRLAGSPPWECLFVDDMEANVRAAADLGMDAIHYRPDVDFPTELRQRGIEV